MYSETDEKILENLWDVVKEIIPSCINYTYYMRDPVLDENNGKMKFQKSFPHGKHKLSIKKMREVWF